MKRIFTLLMSLGLLFLTVPRTVFAQGADEETQLIAALQSANLPPEKDEACSRLKWIGTARSVPALAGLLTDPQLSHSARNALESMASPEAGAALLAAVDKTTGSNQVGIINSLGLRREAAAAPTLAKLLSATDTNVAFAAADALGHIGTQTALSALRSARRDAGPLHDAVIDATLTCANQLLTTGDATTALPVFQDLYGREKADDVRLASYRGIILSSQKQGLTLMVKAIAGNDGPAQAAALQLASKLGGHATTEALSDLLLKTPPPVQIALLQALDLRGDHAAAHIVVEMLDSNDAEVRIAALTALGNLGDGKAAPRIARQAIASTGAEKTAAREALVNLRHGPATYQILAALPSVTPDVQVELIRALGDRSDNAAAPKLLELAASKEDTIHAAALAALALVAGPGQIGGMVQLVVKAPNDDARAAAADTLSQACQHIEAQRQRIDAAPLVDSIRSAMPMETRVALLGVCSDVSNAQVREAMRAAVKAKDPQMQEAALRALCNSQDVELLPDISAMAHDAQDKKYRLLGIRGAVRLLTSDQGTSILPAQKDEILKILLSAPLDADEKRMVLSGVAAAPDLQTLAMADGMLGDESVKVEAATAIINIAKAISPAHPEEATAALKKIQDHAPTQAIGKSAAAALKQIKPKT